MIAIGTAAQFQYRRISRAWRLSDRYVGASPDTVINEQQAKRESEKIKEAIVPSDRDYDLQRNQKSAGNQTQSSRYPDEKRDNDFDHKAEGDGKMFEHSECLSAHHAKTVGSGWDQ
jgi:hypothetical protein